MINFIRLGLLCLSLLSTMAVHAEGVYNVKCYGAKGTGGVDDTLSIQQAIDAAITAGGGKVLFPSGTYRVTNTLRVDGSNIALEGMGNTSRVVLDRSDRPVIKVGHATDLEYAVHNSVRRLFIDRKERASTDANLESYGVHIERARHTIVQELSVHNALFGIVVGVRGGIDIPTQWVDISDITMRAYPIGILNAGIMFFQSADVWVKNSIIEPKSRGIVFSEGANGVFLQNVSIINGDERDQYNYGIALEGRNFAIHVQGCNIENAKHAQVYVGPEAYESEISNSWLGGGDVEEDAVNRVGVLIQPNAHDIRVIGNRIGDQRSSGISSYGNDVLISNNRLSANSNANGKPSINIGGGDGVMITNNRVSSESDSCAISVATSVNHLMVMGNDLSRSGTTLCNNSPYPAIVTNNFQ